MSIEQREITKEYFQTLTVKRANLLELAQTAPSRDEFMEDFDRMIRINRIQLGLLAEMYPGVQQEIEISSLEGGEL